MCNPILLSSLNVLILGESPRQSASSTSAHLFQPSSSNRSTLLHNPCAAPKPILNRYYQKILSVCRDTWRLSLIKSVSLKPEHVFTLTIKKLFMLTCYSVRNPDRSRTIASHSYIIARKPVSPRYDRTTSIFK